MRASETKRVFSGVSLGNPRASPPRIRLQTGGTRSISMGCEAKHFERRRFSWKAGHRLRYFEPPMSRTKTGRDVFPTHSPHHAFQIARICCDCRKEKCCNTLCTCSIQAISQFLACPKVRNRLPYDRNGFTSTWIAPNSRIAFAHTEGAEPTKFYSTTGSELFSYRIKNAANNYLQVRLGEPRIFICKLCDKFASEHRCRLPRPDIQLCA